jgi:ketosteroid isomerase-like protein
MSLNKQTVEVYMQGFRESNHAKILSCLTDDVIWQMPGIYRHEGKEAFDKEIENENFEGRPTIQIHRMTEENNIVIAEGTVKGKVKGGADFEADFCDVFEMENMLIKSLTSYLMSKSASLKFE